MRLIKAVTALLLVVCALAAPAFAEVAAADVSGEILKKLNAVAIDFTAK